MWSTGRSEFSLAPTLGWLLLAVIAGVFVLDGSLRALTGRLTAPQASSAGPLGALGPLGMVGAGGAGADAELDVDDPAVGSANAASEPQVGRGEAPTTMARGIGGPLTEPCLEGGSAGCRRFALDSFRAALSKSRKGELGRVLRLSMFGDSVVATDEIPARLRQLSTAELGDGGPGFVFAHAPHRFCLHEAMVRTCTGSWASYAVSTNGVSDRWYGFGGSTAQTIDGTVVTRDKGLPVTRIAVHYLAQPGGGRLGVFADDSLQPVDTIDSGAETTAAKVSNSEVSAGAQRVMLRATGTVRLFGLVLERERGAVVDNLGIVSVTAKNFVRNDAAHWTSQIRARAPDLVLLMVGANEAQWLQGGVAEMHDYAERFAELLSPIREAGTACLVVAPLEQVEVTDGAVVSRKISGRLVEAQRRAAMVAGCGFFDTLAWMGGFGSAVRWHRRGLLSGDYIHLTKRGSAKLGDALYRALFDAAAAPGSAVP
jgi:lysophospholipase L1-like esterase